MSNDNSVETPASAQPDQVINSKSVKPADVRPETGVSFFMVLVMCILTSVTSVAIYHHYFSVKIVTYDFLGLQAKQAELYVARAITRDQMEANYRRVREELVSKVPRGGVLIGSDAVLYGGTEIKTSVDFKTPEVPIAQTK